MGKGGAIRWSTEQLAEFEARRKRPTAPDRPPAQQPVPAQPGTTGKPPKYRNEKVQVDGQTLDSGKEAHRWAELQQLQAAGQISDLKRQQSFVLAPSVMLAGEARKKPALRYFADFTYVQGGALVVEDVKSRPTRKLAAYRIKKHLMATVHGIHIREV
jgi:hypothetical protein